MGHKVSTISLSQDDLPRRRFRTAAAFAVLIAVRCATASSTCAFTAPSLLDHKSSPSSLFATASIASAIIASVPPPGSKLYQLRYDANNHGQRRQGSSAGNKRGRTDLRYATHADSSSASRDDATSNHLALGIRDDNQDCPLANGGNVSNSTSLSPRSPSLRKRRRMLKYLDEQISRLDVTRKPDPSNNSTDYQLRKAEWAAKYTSLSTLRSTFGSNKNRLWGDYDPTTTRKLYHTLIPRALLALHDMGLSDVDELAPLAYQARMAAKKYARERSRLPGRIGSMVYDGWRQWRRYGKWKFDGMTWEQIWDKYERQVLRETVGEEGWLDGDIEEGMEDGSQLRELNDEELTAKICLRILERSVVTNEMIDRLFLERLVGKREEYAEGRDEVDDWSSKMTPGKKQKRQERKRQRTQRIQADLKAIEKKFDDDIRELLRHSSLTTDEGDTRRRNRSSGSFFWPQSESTQSSAESVETFSHSTESTISFTRGGGVEASFTEVTISARINVDDVCDQESSKSSRKLTAHEVFALRILANTKKRILSLQSGEQDAADESSSSRQLY